MLWEAIKLRVRTETIRYSSRKKKSKQNTLSALQRRLETLEKLFQTDPTEEDRHDIKLVKQDIDNILQDEINGVIIRTKLDWQEHGEKPSKIFLGLEERNCNNNDIKRIRQSTGQITSDQKSILTELQDCYSKLNTTTHSINPDFSVLDKLLPNLPRLNEEEKLQF